MSYLGHQANQFAEPGAVARMSAAAARQALAGGWAPLRSPAANETLRMRGTHMHVVDLTRNVNVTLDWSGARAGLYVVLFRQDATGGRSVTAGTGWPTSTAWAGTGGALSVNLTPSSTTVVRFYYTGAAVYGLESYWTPLSLIVPGEPGILWATDWQMRRQLAGGPVTLWQDSDRTIPVTEVGQPVAVHDSLHGPAWVQTTATARPVLDLARGRYGLRFDGIDDVVSTAADLSGFGPRLDAVVGHTAHSPSGNGCVIESSVSSAANPGTFAIHSALGAAGTQGAVFTRIRGASTELSTGGNGVLPVGTHGVTSLRGQLTPTGLRVQRANGVTVINQSSGYLGDAFGTYPYFMGGRGSGGLIFNGMTFGGLILSRYLSDDKRSRVERWLGQQAGVTPW